MGCTSSKIDDLPAVVLCRDQCNFLQEAIQQRYAFADAHVLYIQALKDVGISLHRFFDQDLGYSASPTSPVLPLPAHRKGNPVFPAAVASGSSPPPDAVAYHSHSNSGSHLHFHSDSDDEEGDSGSLHSGNSSPFHFHGDHQDYHDYETLGSVPAGYNTTMNFMKNRATPSVVYEHRPMSPETVHRGESSSYYPYSYSNYIPSPNPNPNPSFYPYNGYPNYGGGINGVFGSPPPYGSSSPPLHPQPPSASPLASSSSKPPPPPPSPPRNSPWDFLNPFDVFEKYYPPYTPSRDSQEVREEEGIPDLEDEEYQNEVVKEVHGNQKFVDNDGGRNYTKNAACDEKMRNDGEGDYREKANDSVENGGVEYDVHLVDKNVVSKEERSAQRGNVAAFEHQGGAGGVAETMRVVRAQFEKASEAGNEVSKRLEAGKLPYPRKNAVYQVSSKMLHMITPSLSVVSSQPSTSKSAESSSSTEKAGFVYFEDAGMRSRNLSSTLQKLHIWEKKLYDEVKAEEKMRIIHERKGRLLKRLDERGAETHKIDSTRTLVRTLSTKIRIAIQVVDKISVKINKLRDEELWPQLNELIHEFVKMWKVMLECHQNQCQAIAEAKSLDAVASNKKLGDAHLEITMQLEVELIKWISCFTSWIGAQKGYVRALNNWLLKCISNQPEETPDGIAPFSPGRISAPPVFVICNQWSQAMDRISEKEVIDAIRFFAESVLQLYERHNIDLRQRMMVSRDMERKVKTLEREEQKIQKTIQALEKQIFLVSGEGSGFPIPGHIVHQGGTINVNGLHSGLKHIFEAMERFAANSLQVYEEIWARSEEYTLGQANAEVP